jgi:hypothetical protein
MTNVPPPLPAAAPTPAPAPLRRRAGLGSDWLNPILVREVQQAVKGRVFPLTVLLALGVTVAIAAAVASRFRNGGGQGRGAFDAGFAVLVPLLIFVVPMQAYHSMRTELRDGIVEQLLLSRLAPGRILAGKLQAAMVQFVLYVAVLAPLLATSYLLRGVDLPTIALSLLFALIACVVATAFAVSAAAQGVVPALQPIANLGMAFGLGVATFAMIGFIGSGQYARSVGWLIRSGDFGAVVSGVVLGAGVATGIAWLGARSFLLHAFENRSTGFRLCLFVLPVLAYGWMLLFLPASQWSDAFAFLTTILVVIGLVFGIFMVTEQRVLSPRLRAHVPRGTLAAVLATPFLPGRDRGTACLLLYAAALGSLASAYWPASTGGVFDFAGVFGRFGVMATVYGLFYLGAGRVVRGFLPDTIAGNHGGRFVLPVLLFLGCVLPRLVDLFLRGEADEWWFVHVTNPFWTIAEFTRDRFAAAKNVFLVALVVLTLLQVPAVLRGVREVLRASAARRAREGAEGRIG